MILLNAQIQAFLAVVDKQTVHQAAKSLFLTQTAVTQRIKALEEKLDTTLFTRTRRGMHLTLEGEALLQYAHAAKKLDEETTQKIKHPGIDSEVRLSIAAPSSLMHTRIVPRSIEIMKAYPKLLLKFDVVNTETRHHKLKNQQVDFAVLYPEHTESQMETKALKPEKYILVAPYSWKDRKLNDILTKEKIIDFCESDELTLRYLDNFNLCHYNIAKRHFINDIQILTQLIIKEIGFSVLTEEIAKPFLDSNQLCILNKNKIYEHRQMLTWYPRMHAPNYFNAILDMIE